MQRNTLFTLCAATVLASTIALGIVMANPASLVVSTEWRGETSRDWNIASNWSGDAVPEATWTVAVGPNVTFNSKGSPVLSSGAAGEAGDLTIVTGFSVTVTGNTLTLDGAVQHDIDGDIFLKFHASNDSVLKVTGVATLDITGTIVLEASNAVLDLDANVTVSGAGEIRGENNGAEVQIAASKFLTSSLSIVGQMKIAGPGTLDNRGAVVANADGTLELGSNLLLVDTAGSGRWEASGDQITAVLLFSNAHTCALLGDFQVGDCTTLRFDADIDTEGTLSHDATNNKGTIDMENGATFGYSCNTANPCVCTDITSDTTLGCP